MSGSVSWRVSPPQSKAESSPNSYSTRQQKMKASPILAVKTTSLKCLLWMLLCAACPLTLLGFQNPGSQQAQAEPHSFGGTFKTLQSAQQGLIVEWVRRFNSTAKQNVDAEKAYDAARLSQRTTFDAVTHALMSTKLTSQ